MSNREELLEFFSGRKTVAADHKDLNVLLHSLKASDVIGIDEHRKFVELVGSFREMVESFTQYNGANFLVSLRSLLAVGDDGMYSDSLRFLFELIQNVDDCTYLTPAHLTITFNGNVIKLKYNETGFEPLNVVGITGIAEKVKNVDDAKIEIGEKGLGFKSVFGIADSVLIQSGDFSFRLNKSHITVPIPEYDNFSHVDGTELTLTLENTAAVQRISRMIEERYCKPNAIFYENPMLFLNKLTELVLLIDDAEKELRFFSSRTEQQRINDHLRVEKNIEVEASLRKLNNQDKGFVFQERIVGDRFTYYTDYDRNMCLSRYGAETKLSRKRMTLQVVFPDRQHVSQLYKQNSIIRSGALYSFLPTKITVNAPLIIHAPFKLDSSREYVDTQHENAWFKHTIKCLMSMLTESVEIVAHQIGEDILFYLPKKSHYLFSGAKEHCLKTSAYKGENLLQGRIFRCTDGKYYNRANVFSYEGNLTPEDQIRMHEALGESAALFIAPQGINSKDYDISIAPSPYYNLLSKAFQESSKLRIALPLLESWINHSSSKEIKELFNTFVSKERILSECSNVHSLQPVRPVTVDVINEIASHPVFQTAFSEWALEYYRLSSKPAPIMLTGAARYSDVRYIDQETAFDLNDLSLPIRSYLQQSDCKCLLVEGKRVCIPLCNALILSESNVLERFAEFCKAIDKDTQFDITLRLMANSRRLNDAEDKLSETDFLELLKSVRQSGKAALGASYKSYTQLLLNSGASPIRFINELVQNADDCIYSDDITPTMEIETSDTAFRIHYNEAGFTKQNVRAITAIGESTKRLLLGGNPKVIGEKGIGFKAVFAVAERIDIHSNGFHFSLTAENPTIPVLGIEEKYPDESGTFMEMILRKPLQTGTLFNQDKLLELCMCLRRLKHIVCNGTHVQIIDTDNGRTIKIGDKENRFYAARHSFRVANTKALSERQQTNRNVGSDQDIICYIPVPASAKGNYYLYCGLPTRVKINIPMVIDAPFELTTSRDDVLENDWNTIIREQVYRSIFDVVYKMRNQLKMNTLRFVAVKQQGATSTNNTFEGKVFLNGYPLSDLARNFVYVPCVDGKMHQPSATIKYQAFFRKMITDVFSEKIELASTLDYSEDTYNTAYFYLGGRDAKPQDILNILQSANIEEHLRNDEFRRPLYTFLENAKGIASGLRSIAIIPVWDKTPGTVRFVKFSETKIFREIGKKQSDNNDYWVLNEQMMTAQQFTKILDSTIETMDREHAIQIYKKKLLQLISAQSAAQTYQYMLLESSRNGLFFEALQSMTSIEQNRVPLKNRSGNIIDCSQAFILSPGQQLFGEMLKRYIVSDECYAFARALNRKTIEDIQYGDVEDYKEQLTSDDLEDLMKSEAPKLRYGRTIAREFFEKGLINEKDAADYGLAFIQPKPVQLNLTFPISRVSNINLLRSQMQNRIHAAPRMESREVTKKVRGWVDPKTGSFTEYDHRAGRELQLANYSPRESNKYCFCQMCKEAKRIEHIEVACIQQEPSILLPQVYLALCLECSKTFQAQRSAKKGPFGNDFRKALLKAQIIGTGTVTVHMADYGFTFTFLDTHLAEIQAALPFIDPKAKADMEEKDVIVHQAKAKPAGVAATAVRNGTISALNTLAPKKPSIDVSSSMPGRVSKNIRIIGANAGVYRVVVFNGKLNKHTKSPHESRLLVYTKAGKEVCVLVFLVAIENTLYIPKETLSQHKEMLNCTYCQLRRQV